MIFLLHFYFCLWMTFSAESFHFSVSKDSPLRTDEGSELLDILSSISCLLKMIKDSKSINKTLFFKHYYVRGNQCERVNCWSVIFNRRMLSSVEPVLHDGGRCVRCSGIDIKRPEVVATSQQVLHVLQGMQDCPEEIFLKKKSLWTESVFLNGKMSTEKDCLKAGKVLELLMRWKPVFYVF